MTTLVATALIILATLTAIGWLSDKRRASGEREAAPANLTLLPGDISYQNKSGNVRVYFPVTTSIVLSIVLTLLLRFLS